MVFVDVFPVQGELEVDDVGGQVDDDDDDGDEEDEEDERKANSRKRSAAEAMDETEEAGRPPKVV